MIFKIDVYKKCCLLLRFESRQRRSFELSTGRFLPTLNHSGAVQIGESNGGHSDGLSLRSID